MDLEFHLIEHRSVRKLKRYDERWFLSLCDEDSYCLSVDLPKIQIPHVVNYNSVLVEPEFHPKGPERTGTGRTAMPYLITDENIRFVGDLPLTFPVFIPTIPQFLDSCLNCIRGRKSIDDSSCALPQIDMDNLARYLVLDLPSQQDKFLSKVTSSQRLAEYFTYRQCVQERRIQRIMQRRAKYQANTKTLPEALLYIPPL